MILSRSVQYMKNDKVFQMDLGKVYGLLLDKAARKGTIQLPYSKPLPLELIREIAKWCEENN